MKVGKISEKKYNGKVERRSRAFKRESQNFRVEKAKKR